MVALLLIMAMAVAACIQTPVKLSGPEGAALLKTLTINTSSLTNASPIVSPPNQAAPNKTSDDLNSWGSNPRPAPDIETDYDYLADPAMQI